MNNNTECLRPSFYVIWPSMLGIFPYPTHLKGQCYAKTHFHYMHTLLPMSILLVDMWFDDVAAFS